MSYSNSSLICLKWNSTPPLPRPRNLLSSGFPNLNKWQLHTSIAWTQNLVVTFDSFLCHIPCPTHQQFLQTLFKNKAHINYFSPAPQTTIFCLDYINSLLIGLQTSTLLTLWSILQSQAGMILLKLKLNHVSTMASISCRINPKSLTWFTRFYTI